MFKKLFVVLFLVLALAVGGAWGFEDGEKCTVKAGSKIFVLQRGNAVPVMPNQDISVTLGEVLPSDMAAGLTEFSGRQGFPMNWEGSRGAITDEGYFLIIREENTKDCHVPPPITEEN
jgi:hypothetical protein